MSDTKHSRWLCLAMIAFVAAVAAGVRAEAPANEDQNDPAKQLADYQARLKDFEARVHEQIVQAQIQHARAVEALRRTELESKELERARQLATERIKALEEEVVKARAEAEKALSPSTQPAERPAPQAEDAFKLVEKERQALIEAIGAASRPATQPADDVKQEILRFREEREALLLANERLKRQIQALEEQLKAAHAREDGVIRPANPEPAPAAALAPEIKVKGTIKAQKTINGINYATISLGQKDHLEKGMRFRVMDGDVLRGYLTIDLVEQDESVGHLMGPDIATIKPGMVVIQ